MSNKVEHYFYEGYRKDAESSYLVMVHPKIPFSYKRPRHATVKSLVLCFFFVLFGVHIGAGRFSYR